MSRDLNEQSTGDLNEAHARQLFVASCRACHTLADADAAGVMGPDLDLLQPDANQVRRVIREGGGGMPPDLLRGDDADLVARYVARVAGDPAAPSATTTSSSTTSSSRTTTKSN